jgi:hypothetical protein
LCVAATGFAQSEGRRGQGYVFFAPGITSPDVSGFGHFGAGGEALLTRRVGIGSEVGYATPWSDFAAGIGLFSVNGSYNMGRGKLSPFLTGGYTLAFRNGTANGFNFGGGVNYWLRDRIGLRFEVRDNVIERDAHLVGFRVGLAFR